MMVKYSLLLFLILSSSSSSLYAADFSGKVLFKGAIRPNELISLAGRQECGDSGQDKIESPVTLVNERGELRNAFVYLKEGVSDENFETPDQAVVLEQKDCFYANRVVGLQVGQSLQMKSRDPSMHNVRSLAKRQKNFNVKLSQAGIAVERKFAHEEVMIELRCDVHPWTKAYVGVLKHPYFAVTDAEGFFEIKNLKPGRYLVEVWHEKLGVMQKEIQVDETQQSFNLEYAV
jgi:hypothetical protein